MKKIQNIDLGEQELVLVGGKPGVGKSRYLLQMLQTASIDKKILFLSLETSRLALMDKYRLRYPNIDSTNVIIVDSAVTIDDIANYITTSQPDYVFIDYVQLIKTEDQNANSIKVVLDELLALTNKYHVTIVALSMMKQNSNNDIYAQSIYDSCHHIYVLKEQNIDLVR